MDQPDYNELERAITAAGRQEVFAIALAMGWLAGNQSLCTFGRESWLN